MTKLHLLMQNAIRKITIEFIVTLFILLFVYAAVVKLLDFEKFVVQVGQSPLLTVFAGSIAWIVPVTEIIIALMLAWGRFRLIGFYCAFSLMVMFTAYIVAILNFSTYIPCSCGGVLEQLGWTEHLIFNLVFVVLAATGVLIAGHPSINSGSDANAIAAPEYQY